ncbi:uncharacterized protein LOC143017730 isoform X2 [Oratosquilla oratoria]
MTEIKPLKCQMNTPKGFRKTSKWMQYHHWKELKELLSVVIEDYQHKKDELGNFNELEGNTIVIWYKYKPYNNCSCLNLPPLEDEVWTDDDEDYEQKDDESFDLKDKGGRYNELTPYDEILMVNVSCKESQEKISQTTIVKSEYNFEKSLDPLKSTSPTLSEHIQSPYSSPLKLSPNEADAKMVRNRRKACLSSKLSNKVKKDTVHNFDSQELEFENLDSSTNDLFGSNNGNSECDTSYENKVEEENCLRYLTRSKKKEVSKTLIPSVSDSFSIPSNLSTDTIDSQDLKEVMNSLNEGFMETNEAQEVSHRNQGKQKNQYWPCKKNVGIHTSKTERRKRKTSEQKTVECSSFPEFKSSNTSESSDDINIPVAKVNMVSKNSKEKTKNISRTRKSTAKRKNTAGSIDKFIVRRESGTGMTESQKQTPGTPETERITGNAQDTRKRSPKKVKNESRGLTSGSDYPKHFRHPRRAHNKGSPNKDFDPKSQKSYLSNLSNDDEDKLSYMPHSENTTERNEGTSCERSPNNSKNGDLESQCHLSFMSHFNDGDHDDDDELPDLSCLPHLKSRTESDEEAHCEGFPNCSEENKTVTPSDKENMKLLKVDHSENSGENIDTSNTDAMHSAKSNTEVKHPLDEDINRFLGFENAYKPGKSLKDVSSFLESLTEEDLTARIEGYDRYLIGICKGKIPNERHTMFNGEKRWSNNINHELVSGAYTDDQHEFVANELHKRFSSVIEKATDAYTAAQYIWKVLVPAFLLKIVMDTWNLSNTEAECLLQRVSLRGPNDF